VPLGPHGENLAGFITGISEPKGGQSLWVNEKSNYPGGPYNPPYPPGCTPRVDCKTVGHYIQMVWQNTKEIGCGTAPPGAGGLHYSVLVCRYDPPGGYTGQMPYPQPP
jgi:Cysteine-rich secretory protein family